MDVAAFLLTTFVVGLSGALMPGPVTTVTVTQAMRRGHMAGPLVSLGHGIVEGSLVLGLTLGLSQVLRLPLVTGTIGVAGGLCLLYMGIGMVRAPAPADLSGSHVARDAGMGPVAAGMLTSVANPYWALWWATVGLTFLTRALEYGYLVVAAFFLSHFISDLAWLSAIGSAVAAGRKLLTPRVYRAVLGVCGIFLLGLAAYFLVSGARELLAVSE